MSFADFCKSPLGRQRYWARSHLGWPLIAQAPPNDAHRAVAAWTRAGLVDSVITQNVDGLHQRAGADCVLDLHGRLDTVVCLDCTRRSSRIELHQRLTDANPDFPGIVAPRPDQQVNPDGDVELSDPVVAEFVVVGCTECGGVLKPDVVFFGESVPKPRVQLAIEQVEQAAALVVLGSSLTVMSGYRFVTQAYRRGTPVVIINDGLTRGDRQATIKLSARLGPTLSELNTALGL